MKNLILYFLSSNVLQENHHAVKLHPRSCGKGERSPLLSLFQTGRLSLMRLLKVALSNNVGFQVVSFVFFSFVVFAGLYVSFIISTLIFFRTMQKVWFWVILFTPRCGHWWWSFFRSACPQHLCCCQWSKRWCYYVWANNQWWCQC